MCGFFPSINRPTPPHSSRPSTDLQLRRDARGGGAAGATAAAAATTTTTAAAAAAGAARRAAAGGGRPLAERVLGEEVDGLVPPLRLDAVDDVVAVCADTLGRGAWVRGCVCCVRRKKNGGRDGIGEGGSVCVCPNQTLSQTNNKALSIDDGSIRLGSTH